MRLGIDASRANLAQRTGTEWYAFHLVRAALPLFKPSDTIVLYVKEPLRPEWGNLPGNVRIRVLRWFPGLLWTQLRLSWELITHRVDILFVPAHTIPFLAPRRTVTTLHDIGFEHASELYGQDAIGTSRVSKRLLNFMVRLLTLGHYGASEIDYHRFSARLAIANCPTILTISEYSKQDICLTYGVDPARVVIIPCAYDAAAFNAGVGDNRNALHAAQQRAGIVPPYLMTIGRIERKKNALGLVRAFAQIAREPSHATLQLLLVGKLGVGGEAVQRFIHEQGLERRVILPGWTEAADVPRLMAGAAAFILPSLYEGFGIPVLEAMAVGTPVLCSSITALPEVTGGGAELFDPTDPTAIAQAIQRVLGSPERKSELRQRGYARAKEFSWASSAAQLVAVLYRQ